MVAAPAGPRSSSSYLPALDGLRALAIGAVLLFHGSSVAPGGSLGVDLFYVVSGYLITTLLVREHDETGRIDLRGFWARRVRRLLPALYLALAAVAVYAATLSGDEARSLRADILATLTYWSNWRFIIDGQGYFDAFGAPSPLRHTWSLAVEEQWYVLWPIAVALVLVRCRRHVALALVAAATVASGTAMVLLREDVSRAYYGTDTRAQALLIGAATGLLLHWWPVRSVRTTRVLQAGGALALVPVVVMMKEADPQSEVMFQGGYTGFALLTALVVASATLPGGPVSRLFALRPLVALGAISYGLYLWHWPIDIWLSPDRVGIGGWPLFAVRTTAGLAAAIGSYVLLEAPVRRRRGPIAWLGKPWPAAIGAVVVGAVAVVAGGIGSARGAGEPKIILGDPPTTQTTATPTSVDAEELRVLVIGDSVGVTLALHGGGVTGVHIDNAALIGCGLDPAALLDGDRRIELSGHSDGPPCVEAHDTWIAAADDLQPDVVLVADGSWEVYDREGPGGTRLDVGTSAWRAWMDAQVERVGDVLLAAAPDAVIGFLEVPCYAEQDLQLGGGPPPRNDPARVAAVNDVLDSVVARDPARMAVVPLAEWLCDGDRSIGRRSGIALRPDGVHYTPESATLTWNQWLVPHLRDLPG